MAEGGQEKTERATPKRLEEARKKGQVPRSIELSMAAVCIAASLAIYSMGRGTASKLAELMRGSLSLSPLEAVGENVVWPAIAEAGGQAILLILPILGATFLAALAAPLAIGGWNFSGQALIPKFSRLNPLAGLGRMFSARGSVELGKGIAKVFVIGLIATVLLKGLTSQMLGLSSEPLNGAIGHSAALTGYSLLVLCCGLVAIAAVDVPFQLWQHSKELRMSLQEVREEYKESEGSPETRSRIREAQRTLARGRMMQEVPTADVIVTNPTHFAVALRYDDKKNRAPLVVAKGTDLLAAKIREIAAENGVPIIEAPPLARALYKTVDLGREVPAALYVTVAQILTYVYQLKACIDRGAKPPPTPVFEG
jgi:flagellar biosynthetic protein FlhB